LELGPTDDAFEITEVTVSEAVSLVTSGWLRCGAVAVCPVSPVHLCRMMFISAIDAAETYAQLQ